MNGGELQLLPVKAANNKTTQIAYRFLLPKGDAPTFIWFCGFKSEMESTKAEALAAWAQTKGAGCLRFDYSGHGQSGGRFEDGTISRWLDEAAEICALALAAGPAVFVGSSMGGWIALLLCRRLAMAGMTHTAPTAITDTSSNAAQIVTDEGVKAVTLIAPAWDMTRLIWDRASAEARAALLRDGVYRSPSVYSEEPYIITKALIDDGARHCFGAGPIKLRAPVRILHGCQDPDVPWRHSLGLIEALECADVRLTLIKDGEHRLSRPQDLHLLFTVLEEFL
jgi:pimeloyl-ACP methyl ester carboxylesterase